MERVKKNYSKKKSRSIFKSKLFLILSVIILSGLLFFGYLFFHPFYQLTEINLEGANLTSEGSLKNFLSRKVEKKLVFDRSSTIFISPLLLEIEILNSYPHIEKVEIEKVFPDTINLTITERGKEAIWCIGPEEFDCYEIDSKGIAFKKNSEEEGFKINYQPEEQPEIGERVLGQKRVDFIFNSKRGLDDDFEVLKMTIPHRRSLFVDVDNFQIRFDFEDDLDDQLERLEILLEEEIDDKDGLEYIELRYGSSVYYKK